MIVNYTYTTPWSQDQGTIRDGVDLETEWDATAMRAGVLDSMFSVLDWNGIYREGRGEGLFLRVERVGASTGGH